MEGAVKVKGYFCSHSEGVCVFVSGYNSLIKIFIVL